MNLEKAIGPFGSNRRALTRDPFLLEYANLKLAAMGAPIVGVQSDYKFMQIAEALLGNYQEKTRLLTNWLSPVDFRIQSWLHDYLKGVPMENLPRIPANTFILDRHGLARVLSLPMDGDVFKSSIVSSYRVAQGVLHNPDKDRRTTKGVFHVAEGGLPIPGDKVAAPRSVFARLLEIALNPPKDLMRLPFTANADVQAEIWLSLLLRPIVVPAVPGHSEAKRMEVRFFAPGNLVANLDFVESIFGNAGDPYLAENDAALDIEHWTGHTGCVILAPHLVNCTKKELGLPHISKATERQKRDSMCWEKEDEKYNDGLAFKITARDERGVIVTLIADNYFGYCKKEVKTQISYAANLLGNAEEEHAGGAVAFPTYDLGEDFKLSQYYPEVTHTFAELLKIKGDEIELKPEGYAIDKKFPDIYYVPEDAYFTLAEQRVRWKSDKGENSIVLKPGIVYILPSGYKVEMIRPKEGRRWRLIGSTAEGTFIHKPCTVSGGGKSEISKSIMDAIITGPVVVADFRADFDRVEEIVNKEYGMRFKDKSKCKPKGRLLLSKQRSLGSVVKLLSPSPEYTDEYNVWLRSIPYYVKELVFIVKRFYKEDWGTNWRERFHVDLINGTGGNELRYRDQKLMTQYLRIGFTADGAWRTFGLRKDFYPAQKIQTEDDITASTILPADKVKGLNPLQKEPSVKFVENCEFRLFQRPDDAIIRGYDKKTEWDMAQLGSFTCNYEPLTREQVLQMTEDTIRFEQFTSPMKSLLRNFATDPTESFKYVVSSAHPRLVDGKPSKNPRYLQDRGDLENPRAYYLAETGTRLYRRIPAGQGVPMPVNAILCGRRNNPPEPGVRPLAVFNPIHYLELPELFMEFISSMTGKSPSTTGAGSEGALTKGPFNALPPIVDLNNALVSYLITDMPGFISAAGYVGPKVRVDHDISLLVPEIWSRMRVEERDPQYLIKHGYLEKCPDLEYKGKTIPSSLLGYRITEHFVQAFFGRVFANPDVVLTPEMIRPELQDMEIFADAMDNIVSTHQRVALLYMEDGSIHGACPPLKALLHIMAYGHYEGNDVNHPDIRKLFSREEFLKSDWYKARLEESRLVQCELWLNHVQTLEAFLAKPTHAEQAISLGLPQKLEVARKQLALLRDHSYTSTLVGTLGTDPWLRSLKREQE